MHTSNKCTSSVEKEPRTRIDRRQDWVFSAPHTPFSFGDVRQLICSVTIRCQRTANTDLHIGIQSESNVGDAASRPCPTMRVRGCFQKESHSLILRDYKHFLPNFPAPQLSREQIYIRAFPINNQLREAKRNKHAPIIYSGTVPH